MTKQDPIINELARLDGTVYKSTGACRHCDADEKITYLGHNEAKITVMHDDWCPVITTT